MNKRGDISITLLVVFVIVISTAALFSFYSNSGKIESTIIDARAISQGIDSEKALKIKMRAEVEPAIYESYNSILKRNDFLSLSDGDLDEILKGSLMEKYPRVLSDKEYTINYNVNGSVIEAGVNGYSNSGSIVSSERKRVWVWKFIPGETYDEQKASISYIYRPETEMRVNLDEMGLHSLGRIRDSALECKKELDCLQKMLPNFNVAVEDRVKISSKKEFLNSAGVGKVEAVI